MEKIDPQAHKFLEILDTLDNKIFMSLSSNSSKTTDAMLDTVKRVLRSTRENLTTLEAVENSYNILAEADSWSSQQPVLNSDAIRHVHRATAVIKDTAIADVEVDPTTHTPIQAIDATGKPISFDAISSEGILPDTGVVLSENHIKAVQHMNDAFLNKAEETLHSGGQNLKSDGGSTKDKSDKIKSLSEALVKSDIDYAWGGGTLTGPSLGTLVGDTGGASIHKDNEKIGFDCSKLTRFLTYQATGENIGMDTYSQWNNTTEIESSSLKVGDIGFNEDKSHVVMYVGDTKFVEAPESGKQIRFGDMKEAEDRGLTLWRRHSSFE